MINYAKLVLLLSGDHNDVLEAATAEKKLLVGAVKVFDNLFPHPSVLLIIQGCTLFKNTLVFEVCEAAFYLTVRP